ncbi:hypothetical protein Mal4_36160 [Maioricimonas rarisocia]|uniref:Uncharacterized protein n=1 Tax=Maioricimonas rarisocia TaxID=2528026 RepID=A0A517Z9V8_9PLAN|nr:hypothetical protein [Maioricimonas rarisocia]QDU39277.1 hypothetical protein Mal4_36160 [Maioricimonas rarisocia]
MNITQRTPSTTWEPAALPDRPHCSVWVWYKPGGAPNDVMIHVPDEAFQAAGGPITVRQLIAALGVEASATQNWSFAGMTYDAQGGSNPLLDQPLPPSGAWGDPRILIRVGTSPAGTAAAVPMMPPLAQAPYPMAGPAGVAPAGAAAPMPAMPTATGGVASPEFNQLCEEFEADWLALIQIERQLESARKQLGSIQGQLQSLNRDLNADEALHADNQDKRDWTDARRWLRDSMAHVSRYIRDHDIGVVSAAGQRNRFENVYKQYVEPRVPFDGLAAIHREFVQHRKTALTLLSQMQTTHSNASREGIGRARQVLARIGAKVRKARSKR